jgi:hypothetical protein
MLKLNRKLARTATFCAVAVLSTSAWAQAIEVKQQPFADEVLLPFGKPPASLVASQSNDQKGGTWEIKLQDINLANSIQRWATAAGWRVRWDARKHVMIEAPDQITGSFEDAVRTVLEAPGIAASSHPLEVCFYPNTPPLARITLKGDQDKECK